MQSQKNETPVFDFINLLRGIAAWLVVYFHLHIHIFHNYPLQPIPPNSLTYRFILGDFDLGKYAVGVFFIISGFLIPSTLSGKSASLRKFTIHRFFRLYPAYWFSILVFICTELWFAPHPSLDIRLILVNTTMLQKFVGVPDLIGAYWTLQIELIFYFLCGALFFWGRLNRQRAVIFCSLVGAMLCAALRYQTGKELPVAIFIALALMFLGDLLRAHHKGLIPWSGFVPNLCIVSVALIPICLVGYKEEGWRYLLTYWMALLTFVLAYRQQAFFSQYGGLKRLSTFLGDISYSVYLLHGPIGLRLGHFLFDHHYSKPATAFCTFGSTLVVAYACYHGLEAPWIRWGRRLSRGRLEPPTPVEVS